MVSVSPSTHRGGIFLDLIMALTTKREKFCQEYKKCGDQSEAYRKAFNCKNMKPETVNNNAYRLMQNTEIRARIKELQDKIEKKNILSAQQLQEELTKYILDQKEEECIVTEGVGEGCSQARLMSKKVQPKDKLKAIELLCKLAGYNLEKGEINIPVSINFTRNYD